MDKHIQILNTLQITDSLFPSGAFAHSFGLETYVSEGLIKNRDGLIRFLTSYLTGMIGRCDAVFARLSYESAKNQDIANIARLDKLIHSMKLTREMREGSIHIGRQIICVIGEMYKSDLLNMLLNMIKEKSMYGHHPVVSGAVSSVLGMDIEDALLAYLYSNVSGLVAAGIRLIPLGHTDGQRVINEIKPLLVRIAKEAESLKEDDISSFAPSIEIMSMRHEYLYTRLFKS
ncbi:MAG: urease accessory protein UreF [Nitrospirae bacterium]|nr:urease accessory protein UreF [Nitrospirota bacterium]